MNFSPIEISLVRDSLLQAVDQFDRDKTTFRVNDLRTILGHNPVIAQLPADKRTEMLTAIMDTIMFRSVVIPAGIEDGIGLGRVLSIARLDGNTNVKAQAKPAVFKRTPVQGLE